MIILFYQDVEKGQSPIAFLFKSKTKRWMERIPLLCSLLRFSFLEDKHGQSNQDIRQLKKLRHADSSLLVLSFFDFTFKIFVKKSKKIN